jgi:chromosome segregation protein
MNIASLTIQGFKSFGNKTVFTFGKPITGVVGPNGSGKSNVTEALRFVLGEQSFKSMRTKDATDLLFRGADTRANMLSVTVRFVDTERHVDRAEGVIVKNALEKNEVDISRVIYADGKMLYKLNNVEVRLKDIQETMLALGISSKSSWHISQGESDRILLASPLDRRSLVEDALGLRMYHTRIDDAQKKLEKSELNIRETTLKRKEILPEIA